LNKSIRKWLIPLVVVVILALVIVLATRSGTPLSGSFKIIGSNTLTPLSSVWAEEFMIANSSVSISVSGPGTGPGIAALIDGTTDIAQASRQIKQSEIDQAVAKGVHPYEIQVANDGLSVVVHPSNNVSELTIAQLSAIYTNQITNWEEVGGSDTPIVVLSRDTNSGSHDFFLERIVQMQGLPTANTTLQYGPEVLFLPSTQAGVTEVAQNPNAIFYAGLGYVTSQVKTVAVKKTASDPSILPSKETVLNSTYPIARPLFYYTNGEPTGIIKTFIDYCLSPTGQEKVSEVGYIPLA
jgi:phosphate transport system substrate-binding protein